MYKSISVMLIAFAVSTPAQAEIFGFLSSNGGSEQIMDGQGYAPTQDMFGGGSAQGYPFYSGCCDSDSSYASGLWNGYCGSKGCGMRGHHGRHHGGLKGGFGCGTCCEMGCGHNPCAYGGCGYGGCGKGGCGKGGYGYAAAYGFGGKLGWGGHLGHRGHGGKGSDCSSCDGGKGGFGNGGYMEYAPFQGGSVQGGPTSGYDKPQYGTPSTTEGNAAPQPPEVLVEPSSTSDRSAWRRQAPANPFARPHGF